MLQFIETEQDAIREKGLQASTFVAQPFWQDIQKFFHECIHERLKAMEESRFASNDVKARLVDQLLWTKEIVARIERIPQAAIEAARELGEE